CRLAWRERKRRAFFSDDGGAKQSIATRGGNRFLHLTRSECGQLLATHGRQPGRAARDERKVRRLATKRDTFVEHPLHFTLRQPDERFVHDTAVVPQVYRDDWHRFHPGG